MWDLLELMPPILVGQSVLNFLDVKDIVRLETALTNSERASTLRSFLNYRSKVHIVVNIPHDMMKMKWLQGHDFAITKATVYLNKINRIFETKMINEIELVDNNDFISSTALNYFPKTGYDIVTSISFKHMQVAIIMEELFSNLHNLRELRANGISDGWIQCALKGLQRGTNNNIIIEKVCISAFYMLDSSLVNIVKYCPRLQSLSVSFNITEGSFLALSRHCPLLKELNISHLPRFPTTQTAVLCAPVLSCIHTITTPFSLIFDDIPYYIKIIPYLTELKHLFAIGYHDNSFMPLFSQYCLKLETVGIQSCSTTTTTQLLQLAMNCQHLHTIELSKIYFCTDDILIGLTQRCSKLHKLSIVSYTHILTVTDSSLLALSEHCPQLRELYINSCIQITEAAVLQLVHSCKHLHILQLPLTCLSEDTVLTLPVTAIKTTTALTLTFHT